jgi:uncharacterized membrane protein YdbT with pleckstrin-like domain
MGFPEDALSDRETLIFNLKQHWIALMPSFLWTLVAIAVAVVGGAKTDGKVRTILLLAALVGWLILAVPKYLQWMFTRFVLTSDRLITRRGVIAKHSKEIPLERINDVAFSQGIFDRMIGAGSLMIESAGERGQEQITHVRHPERVQKTIYEESEKNQDRMMQPRTAAAPAPTQETIPQQIEALSRLKDQGVINDTEFESKKQELLKRL